MNIWVIGRSYPQKINNMQGSFELEQAKMLAKHGNKVTYIACVFHPFKKVKKWGLCYWLEDNIDIFTYSQIYAIERMKLHLEFFQTMVWKKLLSSVEEKNGIPDVIHVHYPANITIAKHILEYQLKGTKIVCTEHWTQVLKNTIDNYERKRLTLYANNADAFLCVGQPLREAVKTITGTKNELYVVPNIVNELFVPLINESKEFMFVAVGVLFPHKQFDKIIEAFSNTFKGNKHVRLKIIGDGPEANSLKRKCNENGISEQVCFTGKLTRENTAYEVGISNCLICYSNCETFGVPIIEGWACGLPVISTTAAAVRDGWDEGLGIQVSPNKQTDLEEAMRYVHDNYSIYDSRYIRDYSIKNYSEDEVYTLLLKIYNLKRKTNESIS